MRLAIGTTRLSNLATKPIIDIIMAQIRQVLYHVCIPDMQKTHGQVVAGQIVAPYVVGGWSISEGGGGQKSTHIHIHICTSKNFFKF